MAQPAAPMQCSIHVLLSSTTAALGPGYIYCMVFESPSSSSSSVPPPPPHSSSSFLSIPWSFSFFFSSCTVHGTGFSCTISSVGRTGCIMAGVASDCSLEKT
ncbi:unnamed protein product [Musa textilis]